MAKKANKTKYTKKSQLLVLDRTDAAPLEAYEIFDSLAEAQEYAQNNGVAYVGQTVKVVDGEGVKVYVIADEAGTLKGLATGGDTDEAIGQVKEELTERIDGVKEDVTELVADVYSKQGFKGVFEDALEEVSTSGGKPANLGTEYLNGTMFVYDGTGGNTLLEYADELKSLIDESLTAEDKQDMGIGTAEGVRQGATHDEFIEAAETLLGMLERGDYVMLAAKGTVVQLLEWAGNAMGKAATEAEKKAALRKYFVVVQGNLTGALTRVEGGTVASGKMVTGITQSGDKLVVTTGDLPASARMVTEEQAVKASDVSSIAQGEKYGIALTYEPLLREGANPEWSVRVYLNGLALGTGEYGLVDSTVWLGTEASGELAEGDMVSVTYITA